MWNKQEAQSPLTFVLCILFSQSNQILYNIILYNIQKRKTEKV